MLTFTSLNHQLDDLLEHVCVEIQITSTQYKNAKTSYGSVGEWLHGGVLGKYNPDISPQGSMALGTTTKPRTREEFDVDLVCLLYLDPVRIGPLDVYNLVLGRLRESDIYGPMVELRDRCIRLNYRGQFHLDIIPACPKPRWNDLYGEDGIVIPDRERSRWITTNPRGYALWFADCAVGPVSSRGVIQLSAEPLPPNVEASEKAPLQRTVQLYKRRRDVHYNGHDKAPKSILLTTLCAGAHNGTKGITNDITATLDQIIEQSRHVRPGEAPTVPNPTNTAENLARHWQEEPGHYTRFVEYVTVFRDGMSRLIDAVDLMKRAKILNELFDPTGTGLVDRAVKAYHDSVQGVRLSGGMRLQGAGSGGNHGWRGLTTSTAGSLPVAATAFFGGKR